jgi:hypothetical protein
VNIALLVALTVVAGCNGDSETTDGEAANASRSTGTPAGLKQVGTSKTTCPAVLTDEEHPSTCKLVFNGASLESCRRKAVPGGYDLWVHGISCQEGGSLQVPLGCNFANYAKAQAAICRVSMATGRLSDATPTEPTGWTCWAGFDPKDPAGIRNVCWRGSDVLVSNVG